MCNYYSVLEEFHCTRKFPQHPFIVHSLPPLAPGNDWFAFGQIHFFKRKFNKTTSVAISRGCVGGGSHDSPGGYTKIIQGFFSFSTAHQSHTPSRTVLPLHVQPSPVLSHYVPNTGGDGTRMHTFYYVTCHFLRPPPGFSHWECLNGIDVLTPIATPWMEFFKCRSAIYKPKGGPSLPWYNNHILGAGLWVIPNIKADRWFFLEAIQPHRMVSGHFVLNVLVFLRTTVRSGKSFPSTWFEAYYRYLKSLRLHFHYIYLE